MNRRPWSPALAGLAACIALAPAIAARGQERDPLELLSKRNIFDPTRQPNRPPRQEREDAAPPPPVVTVQLTGSIVYPDRAIAFFSGSDPDFNRVVSVQEQVGGFTVEAIDTSRVVLARDEERFEVPVGHGLSRRGDNPWEVTGISESSTRSSRSRNGDRRNEQTRTQIDDSATQSSDAPNDILRRLMERRRQENAQ